jgi:hypothetical protein
MIVSRYDCVCAFCRHTHAHTRTNTHTHTHCLPHSFPLHIPRTQPVRSKSGSKSPPRHRPGSSRSPPRSQSNLLDRRARSSQKLSSDLDMDSCMTIHAHNLVVDPNDVERQVAAVLCQKRPSIWHQTSIWHERPTVASLLCQKRPSI